MWLLGLCLLSVASAYHHTAAPRPQHLQRRRAALVAVAVEVDEEAKPEQKADPEQDRSTIFTMQDRDDGWNDVRGAIRKEIKDREKAWQQLSEYTAGVNDAYIKPTVRMSKVLVDEVVEVLPASNISAPDLKISAPDLKISAPDLKISARDLKILDGEGLKQAGAAAGLGLLDSLAARKQTAKKPTKAPVKPPAKAPAKSPDVVPAAFSVGMLLGVPAVTLALIAFVGATSL